jgi:hypothetical protein
MDNPNAMTARYEARIASLTGRVEALEARASDAHADFLDVLRRALMMVVSFIDARRGYNTRQSGRGRAAEAATPAAEEGVSRR